MKGFRCRLSFLLVSLIAVVVAGCAGQRQSTFREDLELLELDVQLLEFASEYADAFKGGDADAVVALMTEDFVALTPDKEPIEGRQAARQAIASDLEAMTIHSLAFVPREIESHGQWAWVWGRSFGTVTPKGHESPVQLHGQFLWILRRQADRWLIARDCSHGQSGAEAPAEREALR